MLKIYNTLGRAKQEFVPLRPGEVRMYVCGMTVYDYCHVGHARFMMAFDVVFRWLLASGFKVTYVRNITDIDDKIIKRALERAIPVRRLTGEMVQAMHEDVAALGILPPTHEPRATEHVAGMIDMISTLQAKGFAYRSANGDVDYAVRKFPGYGKLSGKSLDQLRAGERVAVQEGKADPLDFVLWKAAKADEPPEAKWPAPFGAGRPGWHIECSAMSRALLGEHFDVHGGGMDLQFPHHENEIAQSEAASGKPFVNYWLHNGFLNVDNEKMSKSVGNFFTIRDVLKRFDGEVLRFLMLRTHYRSPLNFSDAHLEDARNSLTRLYTALKNAAPQAVAVDWSAPAATRFKTAMDDDFNTAEAVAILYELANETFQGDAAAAAQLRALGGVLGVLQRDPVEFLQGRPAALSSEEIERKILQRRDARQRKDFQAADDIRRELLDKGIVLEDSGSKTTWRRK